MSTADNLLAGDCDQATSGTAVVDPHGLNPYTRPRLLGVVTFTYRT